MKTVIPEYYEVTKKKKDSLFLSGQSSSFLEQLAIWEEHYLNCFEHKYSTHWDGGSNIVLFVCLKKYLLYLSKSIKWICLRNTCICQKVLSEFVWEEQ